MFRELLATLQTALEILAAWLEEKTREQVEKDRGDIAADGSGALVGLFNPDGKDRSGPAHTLDDGEDESGR